MDTINQLVRHFQFSSPNYCLTPELKMVIDSLLEKQPLKIEHVYFLESRGGTEIKSLNEHSDFYPSSVCQYDEKEGKSIIVFGNIKKVPHALKITKLKTGSQYLPESPAQLYKL